MTEDHTIPARSYDHGIGGERLNLHRAQVLGGNAPAVPLAILDDAKELIAFKLLNNLGNFVAANLLVQSVKQLLAGRGTRVSGTVFECAPESPEGQEPFAGPIEGDAHSV